jgi:hypothetical protein
MYIDDFLSRVIVCTVAICTVLGFSNHWYFIVPGIFVLYMIYWKINEGKSQPKFVEPEYIPIKLGMTEDEVKKTKYGWCIQDIFLHQYVNEYVELKEYFWDGDRNSGNSGKLTFEDGLLTEIETTNRGH